MVVFYVRVLACLTGYAVWFCLAVATCFSIWLNKHDEKEVKISDQHKAKRLASTRGRDIK